MSTAKHTALPLTASTRWVRGNCETTANFVLDANGKTVAWAAKPEDAALIVQAVNEREGLVRDAERYRWLRDRAVAGNTEPFIAIYRGPHGPITQWMHVYADKQVDAAIDAAKGAP